MFVAKRNEGKEQNIEARMAGETGAARIDFSAKRVGGKSIIMIAN